MPSYNNNNKLTTNSALLHECLCEGHEASLRQLLHSVHGTTPHEPVEQ